MRRFRELPWDGSEFECDCDHIPEFEPDRFPETRQKEIETEANAMRKGKTKLRRWVVGGKLTDEEFREVRYATRSWLLQERVPLTFVQARIFLHHERPETLESISKEFGLPLDKVKESEKLIREKVEEAMERREVFFGHGPLYPPWSEEIHDLHTSDVATEQR
ncbi:MAG: hypothetical protein IKP20_04875 [Candidatus Methanomethylophilaceae archaeon]|nr:hypothetical protein [Candidatus Methanomethylophilaceae archaeon]